MGAGPCCGFCYACAGDDAEKDSVIEDYNDQNKKQSKWCVDDSATERVFIPDGKFEQQCLMQISALSHPVLSHAVLRLIS